VCKAHSECGGTRTGRGQGRTVASFGAWGRRYHITLCCNGSTRTGGVLLISGVQKSFAVASYQTPASGQPMRRRRVSLAGNVASGLSARGAMAAASQSARGRAQTCARLGLPLCVTNGSKPQGTPISQLRGRWPTRRWLGCTRRVSRCAACAFERQRSDSVAFCLRRDDGVVKSLLVCS
jgi:hypothetical protein